jgi:hypothetical protein
MHTQTNKTKGRGKPELPMKQIGTADYIPAVDSPHRDTRIVAQMTELATERDHYKAHAERLAEALRALLNKIDNITSDEFALAAEKTEREAARTALAQWEGAK